MKTTCLLVPFFTAILPFLASTGFAGDVNQPSLDTPYDQFTYLATHNAYANPAENFKPELSNQPRSLTDQLDYGVRVLNPDIWLIRQKPGLLGCWIWEAYPDADTTPGILFSISDPLQVVVGHELDLHAFADSTRLDTCLPWRLLTAELDEIADWAEQHTNQVVTIEFETKIEGTHEGLINQAVGASRISTHHHIFNPNAANPDVPAPQGRAGGWFVDRYGYPTLRQLVEHGKNVVLFPNYPPRAAPGNPNVPGTVDSWKLEVQTVYGRDCLPPNDIGQKWVQSRPESTSINDFTRFVFALVHVPDLPTVNCYAEPGCINDINMLEAKWNDVRTLYNRLPTFVWMDYYDRGFNGLFNPGDPPGPALFVNRLNGLRSALPPLSAFANTSPPATAYGWNNTDVQVNLFGSGGAIQALTSRKWTEPHAPNPFATDQTSYLLQDEGITTVSFSAVGDLGNRSPWTLVDVAIDKTPPTITGMLDRPPDKAGWYASNVTARFQCSDALSGVASCPSDVVVTNEGANQKVTGTSVDRAGNSASTTITNINVDKTGPVILATANPSALWPPNNKIVPVHISGRMIDAGSGVDPATATYTVDDEYHQIHQSGHLTLGQAGNFYLTVNLEARRLGGDADGRHYNVRFCASDRVGHPSQFTVAVIVPHDQGK